MPCFFNYERIKQLRLTTEEQSQVYQELLKENTDEELHEMSEDELIKLILLVLMKIRKKIKIMKKDVRLIYV